MFLLKPRRHVIITTLVAAFLVGLWLGHLGWRADLGFAILELALLLPARRTRLCLIAIALLGLTVGIYRGSHAQMAVENLRAQEGSKLAITGRVSDDPVLTDGGYLSFNLGNAQIGRTPLPSRIKITTNYAKLQRGYKVQADGRLDESLHGQIQMFARLTVIDARQDWLERLRQRFFVGVRNTLPEPLGSFALGLLVGTRALIPRELQNQLSAVGLSHLVAVSGYNLTILVYAVRRLMQNRSKFLATAIPLWLIAGFVVVSGSSASIIRAAIVSILGLLTAYYGRTAKPITLIAIAAALTTFYRPDYLWSDLGWQLSFLAFIGIMIVAPAVDRRLPHSNALTKLVTESLSAQLLTSPLIALTFNQLSLAAPITNLLVMPLVPFAMLASLVAGLSGMLIPAFGGYFALPAVWILNLMTVIIGYFAAKPWASIAIILAPAEVIALYLTLSLALLLLKRSTIITK